MLCERVLGNVLTNADIGAGCFRQRDEVEIFWWELDRRALKKITRDGRSLRIVLALGETLADGDILAADGDAIVVARIALAEVWAFRPADPVQTGLICLELGNLHIPVEIGAREICVAADGPAEEVLDRLGVTYTRAQRRFHPRRCAGMPEVQVSPDLRVTR